jgi:hypothetical protein
MRWQALCSTAVVQRCRGQPCPPAAPHLGGSAQLPEEAQLARKELRTQQHVRRLLAAGLLEALQLQHLVLMAPHHQLRRQHQGGAR